MAKFIVPFLLVLSFFVLPLNGNLRNFIFPLAAIAVFVTSEHRKDLWALIPTVYIQPMLLFFIWIAIACLWSPATFHEQIALVQKYSKLLFFGFFALGFRDIKIRAAALYAFIAAALIPCLLSILNGWQLYHYNNITDPGQVFVNHVATGFLLAFVSYLCFYLSCLNPGWRRLSLIAVGILFSYQVLFINTGRTGYAVYLILMSILCVQIFSWKKALFAGLLLAASFSLSYIFSPVMQSGFHYIIDDVKHYQKNHKDTSLGFRMQFHYYAQSLFLQHPVFGNGTASYLHSFEKDNPTPLFPYKANPHSQYWLILVEQGLVGLFLWILTLLSLLFIGYKAKMYGPILFAFTIVIVVSSFSDSILMLSPIGQIFVILSALCLGELLDKNHKLLKVL